LKKPDYLITSKISKSGKTHIPKIIRKAIGRNRVAWEFDAKIAVMLDPSLPPEKLIESLEMLKTQLIHKYNIVRG
jgi:hypothetical protein